MAEVKFAAKLQKETVELAVEVLSANSDVPYRATLTEAVADFAPGVYFKSDDKDAEGPYPGVLWIYQRTDLAPFYVAMIAGTASTADIDAAIAVAEAAARASAEGASDVAAAVQEVQSYGSGVIRFNFAAADAETWTAGAHVQVLNDTGTHTSKAGDFGAASGQTPNSGWFVEDAALGLVRTAALEGDRAVEAAAQATTAGANAVAAAAVLGAVQTAGRPVASSLVAGTTTENGVCILDAPAAVDGEWGRIRYYAAADDVLRLASVSLSGLNATVAESASVAVVAGYNDIDLVGRLPIKAGQYPALIAPASNRSVAAAADGNGFWTATASTASRSFTLAAGKVTTRQLQVSIDLVGYAPANIKDRQRPYRRSFTIGRSVTPTAGSAGLPIRNYVIDNPATENLTLDKVRLYAGVGGSVRVDKVTKSGDTYTKVPGSPVLNIEATSGSAIVVNASSQFTMVAGEFLRIRPSANNLLRAFNASPERFFQGYLDNGGSSDSDSFTDATVSISGIEIGFDFVPYDPAQVTYEQLLARFAATTGGGGSDDYMAVVPSNYALGWMLGQSNGAGRGPTMTAIYFGDLQAWKWYRATPRPSTTGALQPLVDPTGNDDIAKANNFGSSGPAIADAIRHHSRGQTGTIIVNSCEGGQPASEWNKLNSVLWDQAVQDLQAALADAATKKLNISHAFAYWAEGESDATATYPDEATRKATFKTNMIGLRDKTRAILGPKTPMLMMRVGTPETAGGPYETGFATIRQAQQELAETEEGFFLVHTEALYYRERGLMNTGYHYAQSCYDEIGWAVGDAGFSKGAGLRPLGYNA